MSTTGLDLPLLPNADQIRRRMFARVRRGFDPDQVREYLSLIADQVEHLEEQVREARLASEAAITRQSSDRDPAGEMAERIADILRTTERHSEDRRREAEEQARAILAEARAEADRVRLDAQTKAEKARQDGYEALALARAEADRAVGGLVSRREELSGEFEAIRQRILGIAGELSNVVEARTQSGDPSSDTETPTEEALFPSALPGLGGLDSSHEELWMTSETVDLQLPDLELDGSEEDPGGAEV